MLTGCYDLERCPPTFDVVTFTLRLEMERIKRGDESVEIEILPGPIGGFRKDNLWPHSLDERRALLRKIVVPMCAMLPSCRRVVVHDVRPEKKAGAFGFGQYSMPFRDFIAAIGNVRPLRPAVERARDARLVTITLRECEHHPARNSKVAEWHRAAVNLKLMGYRIVVVRDAIKANEALGDLSVDSVAATDLEARASLYRSAACNMFVSNGPAWFAMALDAPVLIMRPATDAAGPLYGAAQFERMGVPEGQQMPGSPAHQRLVWQDDTAANIIESCCRFMEDVRIRRSAA